MTTNLFDNAISLLGSGIVDLQNADPKTTVYTVPPKKIAVVIMVIIRQPTASLADGVDFDFGAGANADNWKQAVDLAALIGTNDYYVITNNNTLITQVFVAGETFGVKPSTGATADAQATMDVFGYEFDA